MSQESDSQKAAVAQHDVIGVGQFSTTGSNSHPEAQWFGGKNLGLFIHWGISSVQGKVDLSWGMVKDKPWAGNAMSPNEYWSAAPDFQPDRYEPERWLSAVAEAGFDYAVLTTKHHDGYLMWPARQSALGTATHMGGRDLVQPFVDGCRNVGLKVGLYYSPPDWYYSREHLLFDYPGLKQSTQEPDVSLSGLGLDYEQKEWVRPLAEFNLGLRAYIRSHIFELLERYGKIDLLWFDGRGVPDTAPAIMELEEIRARQPHIVINPRLTGEGDYATYECRDAEAAPEDWWEKCTLWNEGGWGYINHESYLPGAEIFDDYRQVHEAGGNYLINAGARPDGAMPDVFYRELATFQKLKSAMV